MALDEAVAIALRGNRDILLKAEEVKKAKLKIQEARANLYPSFGFTGGWKDTRDYYTKKDFGQTYTQFTLKQYLYRGGKTVNTIQQYEDKVEVSEAVLDKTKLEILLNVQKAFYLLLLSGEYADLNQNILENTQAHLNLAEERFRNGQASESEVLSLRNSLAAVEEAYLNSLSQRQAAQALLKNYLYLEEAITIRPQGQFVYEPKELAYDEAFLRAMRNRPEIKQYLAQERADKKGVEIARADNRPAVYASWDYYTNSASGANPVQAWEDHNTVNLVFSWPIFDGWLTKSKVEQAIVDLKETRLNKEKAVKDIALELKNAYLALTVAVATIKTAESDVALYQDNLSSVEAKSKKGITSSLDLDDAGLKYYVSIFNAKQSIYDYFVAKVSFDKATGGI